jgi:hypothetical protein
MSTSFIDTQYKFAAHLRNPTENPIPNDIEPRRMKIYSDLVYNNIESFVSSSFPVLRKLYNDESWHNLVRGFVSNHISHSPYFLEISQEFLSYLQQEYQPLETDPPFLLELAHYEWVELALDVSEASFLNDQALAKNITGHYFLNDYPVVSPLSWSLSYEYPVHKIGPDFQPNEPPGAITFLVVYRNRAEQVKFLEINQVTARLLQLLEENSEADKLRGEDALNQIADELQMIDSTAIVQHGATLLQQLFDLDIVVGCRLKN